MLGVLGRLRDAHEHAQKATRLLERELAAPLTGELALTAAAVRAPSRRPAAAAVAAPERLADCGQDRCASGAHSLPLVGREVERARLDHVVGQARQARVDEVLLILGAPGIGKTRLLDHLADHADRAGCRVLRARGFEAEMVRPYGAWIDALRSVPAEEIPPPLRHDLAGLLPGLGATTADEGDRARLFDGVAAMVRSLATARPLVLVFDDMQWLDEASLALLHFVARSFLARGVTAPLLIAGAARSGEADENRALARLRQSLEREQRIGVIELGPLDAVQTGALLDLAYPSLRTADLCADSGGVPLFALELARSRARGNDAPERSLDGLLAGELARLDDRTRELAEWAAAYGREIVPELLGAAADVAPPELAAALRVLERRGLLRAGAAGRYDFAHDLMRQAAYRALSQPRRRLLHRGLVRALQPAAQQDPALLADLAHHASLAGDHATAARSFARAADRCLKLFANADALELVARGLAHVERLPDGAERACLHVDLLQLKVYALGGAQVARAGGLADALGHAIVAAQAHDCHAETASALFALSFLHYHAGDPERTRATTLQAADASLATDAATRARQLAATARCLLHVDADVARPRALLAEAEALARAKPLSFTELEWGRGLLLRWDGDLPGARNALERALALARVHGERWREYECLIWLAQLELELLRFDDVAARCDQIDSVAHRLGADAPIAAVLRGLARMALGAPGADGACAAALESLRTVDSKAHLAYALNWAAEIHRQRGSSDAAATCALEALRAAQAVDRHTEVVVACALLAGAGSTACAGSTAPEAGGREDFVATARAAWRRLALTDVDRLSARARSYLALVIGAGPGFAPLAAPPRPAVARSHNT
jgi:hypothetical protein